MTSTPRPGARLRPRRFLAAALAIGAIALVACEPPPPADGRDLAVSVVASPTGLVAGQVGTIKAVVTNRGSTAADGSRFGAMTSSGLVIQAVEGVGVAGCTIDGAAVGCDLGDLAPGQYRTITVTVEGVAAASDGRALLAASSAGTEAAPDPHPNQAVVPVWVISPPRTILLEEPGTVASGTTFDVPGTTVSDGPYLANFVRVTVPGHLEAVSVTVAGQTTTCTPTGNCGGFAMHGVGPGSPVSIRLRAVRAAPAAVVGLSLTWSEIGSIGGSTRVHVIDPTVTSEVHPELADVADGVVGVAQPVAGAVRNTGSTDHEGVVATVRVPEGVRVDEATWSAGKLACTIEGREVTCPIGVLPSHASVALDLRITPLVPGTAPITASVATTTAQDDPDPVADATSTDLTVIADIVDLGLTVTADRTPAVEGIVWTLSPLVTNHGTIAATDVGVTVALPAGVEVRSAGTAGALPPGWEGCTTSGRTATCRVATLAPGATLRVRMTADVEVGDDGPAVVTASSDQIEPLPDLHPNEVDIALAVDAAHADVAGIITVPAVAYQGQPTTIQAGVRNNGPSAIAAGTNVLVLPSSWTITSVAAASGDSCSVDGTTVTCQASNVGASVARSATVIAVPGEIGPGQTIRTTASSGLPDPNPANDELVRSVEVRAAAVDIGLTATASATLRAGSVGSVNLTVRNAGPAAALDSVLTVSIPDALAVEQVTTGSTGFTCTPGSGTLTCTHPAMPTGTATIALTVRPIALGDATVAASVATSTAESPDALANSATVARTVTPVAATLRGRMVDAVGAPVQGSVRVYKVGVATPHRTVTVYSYGTFDLSVEPGGYQLEYVPSVTFRPQWFGGATRGDATVLTAADLGEVHQLDVTLETKVLTAARGTVVDQAGAPVAGVGVSFYREGDGLLPTHRVVTGADGTYSASITEGQYRIVFGAPSGSGLRTEWFDDQPNRALAALLTAPSTPGTHELVADAVLAPG